jgi:hypothetical protein
LENRDGILFNMARGRTLNPQGTGRSINLTTLPIEGENLGGGTALINGDDDSAH